MDKPDKYAVFKCGELSELNLVISKNKTGWQIYAGQAAPFVLLKDIFVPPLHTASWKPYW